MMPLNLTRGAVLLLLVFVGGFQVRGGAQTAVAAPAGAPLLLELSAEGVQIYTCAAKGNAFEWTLKAPEAELVDKQGHRAVRHFAGPTWKSTDGSSVVGEMIEKADAPTANAIPWLLLRAKSHEGSGVLSAVAFIRRADTKGGLAPTTGCDATHASTERRVPYSATYQFFGAAASAALQAPRGAPVPPKGFTALFNGQDLSGWRGRPGNGGVFSPYVEAKFTPEEREAKKTEWNADRDQHWSVDKATGELVSDGHGVHLATEKAYGDFELLVDWKLTQPNGDSGIYLRDYPQVQIWDPANPKEQKNGADKGSGGLWNDNPDNPGRWPLVKADNPIGEWNTLAIKMVGTRVWVILNGKPVVVGQVLDNFFDRTQPILPTGSIELQTHGSEVRFRNIYVREIPAAEGKQLLATIPAAPPK